MNKNTIKKKKADTNKIDDDSSDSAAAEPPGVREEPEFDFNSLSEESMSDEFGRELFPNDGRGSTDHIESTPHQSSVISTEQPGGVSEYSIRSSSDPDK